MAAIIELELSPEEFALEETLTTIPEAQIEIERVVTNAPDRLIPYIWVRTDDFDAFEATLEDTPLSKVQRYYLKRMRSVPMKCH